jgi:hypothetical protein
LNSRLNQLPPETFDRRPDPVSVAEIPSHPGNLGQLPKRDRTAPVANEDSQDRQLVFAQAKDTVTPQDSMLSKVDDELGL